MWRLVVKDGKVDKMVLVASGFNVANGTAVKDDCVYHHRVGPDGKQRLEAQSR